MKTPHPKPTGKRPAFASLLVAACVLFTSAVASRAQATATTTNVVTAANAFMALLNTTQKTFIDSSSSGSLNTSCLYNSSLTNAEVWSNIPVSTSFNGATRNGLIFSGLTSAQTNAAIAVATAALSTTGKKLWDDVRASDRYISGEVTNGKGTTSGAWGFNKYFIAFIGAPSNTAPWMLQLCGHHIAYNITFNAPYLSGTPLFAGTEPNSWTDSTGTYSPLGAQRTILVSLRPTLTTAALLSGTFSDVVFGPNGSGPGATSTHDTVQPKSYPTSGRGQLYSALNSTQQGLVLSYIQSWVNFQAADRAADLLPIYTNATALAETYVGYAGSSTTMSANANYFRVDGPRLWIEFSVQTGVYDNTSVHDHGIWRDKLADYGAAFGTNTIATTVRPPSITSHPASQTNTIGSTATFSVSATSAGTGTSTLYYQWYKDSAAIASATNASYAISSVVAGDAGSYFVKVFSTGGLTNSSSATLTVTIAAANTAPTLNAVADRTITPGTSLSITNVASDSDIPVQTLTFALLTAPTNTSINSNSGILSWRPLIAQANSTNSFSVAVADNGTPSLSVTQSFTVFVSAATAPTNTTMNYSNGTFEFSIGGIVGPDYIIQGSTNLTSWETLYTTNPAAMPFSWNDGNASSYPLRFYRVLLGP